jgi:pimeloyl-ACP methyl ester carboxylesterase
VLGLGVALALGLGLASPSRSTAQALPATEQSTPVEFSSVGGLHLRGRLFGAGSSWVILVHDQDQDSRAWRGLPLHLSAQGFRVLAFDLRGYGASKGRRDAGRVRADVGAALGFARSHGARRLFVIGAGVGAGAALVAASEYPIRAFVALSPRRSGRDDPEQTRAPKLIFVGSLDHRAAVQADDVFRRSIGFATLNSTPVDVQGTELLRSSWGDNVRELIVIFLRDYVV